MEVEYLSEAESIDSDAGRFRGKHVSTSKDKKDETSTRAMIIHLFGTTPEGKSVRVEVNGFRPFFYVALPPTTNPTEESRFKVKLQDAICAKISKSISNTIQFELVRKQKLIGFTGGQTFPFLKISVPSLGSFYELRKLFLDDRQIPKFRLPQAGSKPLEIFESNIDPMLRFFHIRDLQPCGWACVKGLELESADDTIQLRADWDSISPSVSSVVTAPFKHAFWDIECYSHDKEFPVAQQGYRRVAKQLWQGGYDVSAMPGLLEEAFAASAASAGVAGSAVKIPPLKNPKLAPRAKEISAIVTAPKFIERLKEIWEGRDGLLVKQKAERLASLTKFLDSCFGRLAPIAGDPIIQIGTVSVSGRGGSEKESHIFVLGGCAELSSIPDAHVHVFKTEKELLLGWFIWLIEENFDIFSGYNIFGFDERYIWERLIELGLEQEECVQRMTRLWDEGGEMKLQEKFLSSSALGDNMLYMWNTPGRLRIDLYSHIKRKVQLTSYKLDSVCAAFLSGKLGGISAYGAEGEGRWLLKTKQRGDARLGRYVQVLNELGEDLSDKMKIIEITGDGIVVESEEELVAVAGEAVKWAIVKDDVSPQELFRLHREGGDVGRARIAAYCIQDCDLVYELYKKLDVFNEAMSMANVCSVPVSYIFTRGQGIKIESLIFKDCMLKDQLIVVQPAAAFGSTPIEGQVQEDSYEGAIVLDPVPGFYTEAPIGVCDFASLYPSTIISENISHDMLVWTKDYDMNDKLVCVKYGSEEAERFAPPGTRWTDIEFDILRPDPNDTHKNPKKTKQGTRICRYAQLAGNKKGSLPQIVGKLLAARKAKRAEITKTDDPFKKALLDAEQNAYKITANSLYGQLGSRTFKIRLQDLAASVTAYARKQIMFSKDAIEEFYGPAAGDPRCSAEIVYGDTDSLFVCFNPRNPETGERLQGREAIVKTIELTEEAGHFITQALRAPHDFEYDKVFSPFIIFSKKRYVGNKYEDSPDDFKETSMGIVLKRRDNAPLLKMIYGGAIDKLLNSRDIAGATAFVQEKVRDLVDGHMKLSQLTITKSLAADYEGTPPAHKMLADRITARDPGNAPASGDRVGFVYVQPFGDNALSKLQGDKIETPQFVEENGLKIDTEYYINHQLINPLSQLFGIVLESMPGYVPPDKWSDNPDKLLGQRELLAADILFKEALEKAKGQTRYALSSCREVAKKNFILTQFGTSASTSSKRQPRQSAARSSPPTLPASLQAVAPKKQSSLDIFIKQTAIMTDTLLARDMRAAKRERKAKEAKKD